MNQPFEPPKEYYVSAWEWVNATSSDEGEVRSLFKEIYPERVFQLVNPKSLENPPDWRFRDGAERIPESFVTVVPDGRLWGRGAVISPDNKLIWNVSQEISFNPREHSIFQQQQLPPAENYTETLGVLTFPVSVNYYHWMLDILPKIDLLRRSGLTVDKYLIIRDGLTDFQRFTLSVLGLPEHMLAECTHGMHIKAARLVVPSHVMDKNRACHFLRNELMVKRHIQPDEQSERLYISRADTFHRHVLNEDEVTGLLAKYGFRTVTLKHMTVDDQIRLFSSAKIIVAPHGAGLTNLVFCKPGTKIIEFFSPNYIDLSYWRLSSYASLDYYYLIGEGVRPPEFVNIRILEDHITVGMERLAGTLKLAGIG